MQTLKNLDQNLFLWLNSITDHSSFLNAIIKICAEYLIYSIPLIFIIWWFWSAKSKKDALLATIGGLASWGAAFIIGSLIKRPRPFITDSVHELVFHRPTYSFPSDHAAFLFGLSLLVLLLGYRKFSYWLFGLTFVICISRVIAGIHWPSDILAGWLVGLVVGGIIWWLRAPILKYIVNPIMWLARKLRLAS